MATLIVNRTSKIKVQRVSQQLPTDWTWQIQLGDDYSQLLYLTEEDAKELVEALSK